MKTWWDLLLELAAAEEKLEDDDDAIAEIKTEIKVVMVGCYGRRVCKEKAQRNCRRLGIKGMRNCGKIGVHLYPCNI